jgi:hypothetical protein
MSSSRSPRVSRAGSILCALPAAVLACALIGVGAAGAQTTFGTLSNFDCFNDTGQPVHGFEIELDGLTSADVLYTSGAPWNRYGDPFKVDFAGGVYVRYVSPYDTGSNSFTKTTPMAPAVITPTDGHSCFAGAMGGAYDTSGCEHFGVSINGNPTNTVYRWLVEDPAHPGFLIPAGTKVNIPAPVWIPPQPAAPPVVQAVIAAEPPEAGREFGDAKWVKIFVTQFPKAVELDHMVTDDPAVPQDAAEVEVEWKLLQSKVGGGPNEEELNEAEVAGGNEAVMRRYEFYQYTGPLDAESGEAMADAVGPDGLHGVGTVTFNDHIDPATGEWVTTTVDLSTVVVVGNYIGAQIAQIDLNPPPPGGPMTLAASVLPDGQFDLAYHAQLVTGGKPPYTLALVKGVVPAGLAFHDTGKIAGLPTKSGKKKFTVEVTDQDDTKLSGQFEVTVFKGLVISTKTLKKGKVGRPYKVALKAAGGSAKKAPRVWSLMAGSLPDGLTIDGSGVISGTPTVATDPAGVVITFQVTDPLGGEDHKDLTLIVN